MDVQVKISVALQGTDLPELVVDHHVVGLHVPMHDAHAVAVVQSLGGGDGTGGTGWDGGDSRHQQTHPSLPANILVFFLFYNTTK